MTDTKVTAPSRLPSRQIPTCLHTLQNAERTALSSGGTGASDGAANSHEILIMPTQAMREADKDYALCCAVPLNSPGVIQIFGRQTNDERKFGGRTDAGNPDYGLVGGETLIVFDNVFVPWERVFMAGEHDFAGILVERFATLHRQNYGGCKGGVSDIIIGATAVAAEMQGSSAASHIKDKLAEMMHLTETIYAGSISCSAMGQKTRSGAYYPDPSWLTVQSKMSPGTYTRLRVWLTTWQAEFWPPCRLKNDSKATRSAAM